MNNSGPGAHQKALEINLDGSRLGTFAEIGAGQEVAGWFFHAGKASSTVAKSISAYDMATSDALYGHTDHYVSRARLEAMLDCEYRQLVQTLEPARGRRNAFFVFADTVATHGSLRSSGGHGWLGIRFQSEPGAPASEIIIHIEMSDSFTTRQQEAVGLVGVNLVHGAFTLSRDPVALIRSLMDGLDRRRIEIDMVKFSGPLFGDVDSRLTSLQLVEQSLTDAAMFTASGEVVQPSEELHGRPVLVERGSFRPVTNLTVRMLDGALRQIRSYCDNPADEPVVIMEMTLNNLVSGPAIDDEDFLARASLLSALSKTVLISNYTRFDCLTTYLRQYTRNAIGLVVGVPTLRAIFDERFYTELEGGLLEGLGRLFAGRVKLFAHPAISAETGALETADTMPVSPNLEHLYKHLLANGFVEPLREFDADQLGASPGDVLQKIQSGDASWADFVPPVAAALIREKQLFGLAPHGG